MKKTGAIYVPKADADELERLCLEPDSGVEKDRAIFDQEYTFDDGRRMAVQVVSTTDPGSEACWTQGVLFSPDGNELGCTNPGESFAGEYSVWHEGTEYEVTVKEQAPGSELIIPLPNGGTLRCGEGHDHQWGGYLRICNDRGEELLYWDVQEWELEGEGESVIGAVFAAALKPLYQIDDRPMPAEAATEADADCDTFECDRCHLCHDIEGSVRVGKDELVCEVCAEAEYEVCPKCGHREVSDGYGGNDCPECWGEKGEAVPMGLETKGA